MATNTPRAITRAVAARSIVLVLTAVAGCGSAEKSDPASRSETSRSSSAVAAPAWSVGAFRPRFGSSGLVSNEYAFHHANVPGRRASPDWVVTSGSLFASRGAGWTGVPDREAPNARSSQGTDSAVFRLVSRRRDFSNVRVSFQLLIQRHVVAAGSEPHTYDGVTAWLHYASPTELYALSVMRWDGLMVIKRKTPGGPSNGGSYQSLASVRSIMPVGRWVPITVQATSRSQGVELGVWIDGKPVLQQVDTNSHALTDAGAVGIRGDNTQFKFRDYTAQPL